MMRGRRGARSAKRDGSRDRVRYRLVGSLARLTAGAESGVSIFYFLTPVFGWEYHRFVKAGANIELKGSDLPAA